MIYFSFYPNYKNNLNVNGNAVLTEKITKKFFNKKKDVIVNTTSSNMFLTKLRKFYSYFIVIYHIIFKKQKNLYTVLLDHHGFYFHTLFFFIFQYLFDSIIIYHHSFRYINKKYYLLNLLKNKKFIHIATSQKQLLKLKKFYGIKKIYLVENNFILLGTKKKKLIKKKNQINIIYFSALIKSKGIYDYIKIAKKFYNYKNLKFSIYGNHCSPELYKKLSYLMKENIIYDFKINIHGAAKTLMYQNTDILLFPSKHPPETTPLVIDECIDNLIIPISYNIGDVKQMIGTTNLICENREKMEKKLLYVAKNIFSYKKRIFLLKKEKIVKSFKYSCLLNEFLLN